MDKVSMQYYNAYRILRSFAVILWLLSTAACSMQNSKHANEAARQDQKALAGHAMNRPTDNWAAFKQSVVRMDYLRPVASIKKPRLYIYKEKRRLYVLDDDVLVRDYPIGLGEHPKGDKVKQGDGRTPVGTFFVCVRNGRSRFGKSLGISYPSLKHAQRALFAGLINADEYRRIRLALKREQVPPWNTRLGGEIFVHGGGAHTDWTDGCVALYDSDMQELFRLAKVGTPITIRP